jgi:hypothetical protein
MRQLLARKEARRAEDGELPVLFPGWRLTSVQMLLQPGPRATRRWLEVRQSQRRNTWKKRKRKKSEPLHRLPHLRPVDQGALNGARLRLYPLLHRLRARPHQRPTRARARWLCRPSRPHPRRLSSRLLSSLPRSFLLIHTSLVNPVRVVLPSVLSLPNRLANTHLRRPPIQTVMAPAVSPLAKTICPRSVRLSKLPRFLCLLSQASPLLDLIKFRARKR